MLDEYFKCKKYLILQVIVILRILHLKSYSYFAQLYKSRQQIFAQGRIHPRPHPIEISLKRLAMKLTDVSWRKTTSSSRRVMGSSGRTCREFDIGECRPIIVRWFENTKKIRPPLKPLRSIVPLGFSRILVAWQFFLSSIFLGFIYSQVNYGSKLTLSNRKFLFFISSLIVIDVPEKIVSHRPRTRYISAPCMSYIFFHSLDRPNPRSANEICRLIFF